ncbi:MAG: SET domain-containing protein [Bernardetiaceae bacterium]
MIHPHTELRYLNDAIGYGVFATALIPKGTITYVKDALEVCVAPEEYLQHAPEMQQMIDKYSYIDPNGNRIVSWDFAKYVNHCCQCNTISTGYGFEIAIRDIQPGEQLTDEYGIFNLEEEMEVCCGQSQCRKRLHPSDFDRYYAEWDQKIMAAMPELFRVEQPLFTLLDDPTQAALSQLQINPAMYRSVYALRYTPHKNPLQVPIPPNGLYF